MEFRPYQVEGFQALWNDLHATAGNPIVAWPTGTGKSLIPAVTFRECLRWYPRMRGMMLTHSAQLIKQNVKKVNEIWPDAPIGINSAEIGIRDVAQPFIFGGVGSVVRKISLFGHRDILMIDEAQLVSEDDESQYLKVIAELRYINPALKVVGLSATPYRMGNGMLTEGKIFTHICHDLTDMENFNRLIFEGYLSPIYPYRTLTELDVSKVKITAGDYNLKQLEAAVDKDDITRAALTEVVQAGQSRYSWLIFASGIEHAEHIAAMLMSWGIDCAAVHSKQTTEYNNAAIEAFQSYKLRAIVNYGKLTTGFDHPGVDLIAMLRPTNSTVLWVQMLGRGTRPCIETNKQNCICLDFARNAKRLGPINDPVLPRKKGEGTGEIPVKICEACGCYNHISARVCVACGAEFEFKEKLVEQSGTDELLRDATPVVEMFDVNYVLYAQYFSLADRKTQSTPLLKATYYTSFGIFTEYVSFQSKNAMARHMAHEWFRERHAAEPPATTAEALMYQSQFKMPRRIRVHVNLQYPRIIGHEY